MFFPSAAVARFSLNLCVNGKESTHVLFFTGCFSERALGSQAARPDPVHRSRMFFILANVFLLARALEIAEAPENGPDTKLQIKFSSP